MRVKFGLFTRLQFALLAIISPQRLVEAVTAGFFMTSRLTRAKQVIELLSTCFWEVAAITAP